MPNARAITAMSVNPGLFHNMRNPNRKSCPIDSPSDKDSSDQRCERLVNRVSDSRVRLPCWYVPVALLCNALPWTLPMKLTFWGAAGTVTGSMHMVEAAGKRLLLDCGLYQGRRKDAERINRHLPFDGSSIDAVVLSHAHIDHSGNLPTLVKSGFSGPIFTTPATVDLCNWMLRDTAHIQEKDAEFVNHRLQKGKAKGGREKE